MSAEYSQHPYGRLNSEHEKGARYREKGIRREGKRTSKVFDIWVSIVGALDAVILEYGEWGDELIYINENAQPWV